MYVCIHTYIHAHTYIRICISQANPEEGVQSLIYMHTYMHTCLCVRVCVRAQANPEDTMKREYKCVYTHTHTHTHMYMSLTGKPPRRGGSINVCIHTRTHIHMYMYTTGNPPSRRGSINVCIHTHTHTHTYICICISQANPEDTQKREFDTCLAKYYAKGILGETEATG